MADNYTFKDAAGNTKTARALESAAGSLLPSVLASTAVPDAVGFQNAAVTTVVALPSIPSNATHALMTVDVGGGDIRFREDASNPTTAVGLLVQAGNAVEFTNLADVRVVSTSGTTNVNISYRRYDQ